MIMIYGIDSRLLQFHVHTFRYLTKVWQLT